MAVHFELLIDLTPYTSLPQVGWGYIADTGQFNYGQLSVVPSIKITKLAFRDRFTSTEKARILGFGLTNYNSSNPTIQSYALSVLSLLMDQMSATYNDLSLSELATGLDNLIALGLLDSSRKTVILNTPPTYAELYKG